MNFFTNFNDVIFRKFIDGINVMVSSLLNTMNRGGETAVLITVFLIAVGAIIGIFGYKIFKFIIAINSAIISGLLVWTLLALNGVNSDLANALTAISAIGGGIFGFFLYQVVLFLQGLFTGSLLTILAITATGNRVDLTSTLIVIAVGIITGILIVKFKRFLLIVSYSLLGAFLFAAGIQFGIILSATGNFPMIRRLNSDLSWLVSTDFLLVIGISLGIVFVIIEYALEKKAKVFSGSKEEKEFKVFDDQSTTEKVGI